MKHKLLIIAGLVLVVGVAYMLFSVSQIDYSNDDLYIQVGRKINFKNTAYTIEGQSVKLVNGFAQTASATNSASMTVTRYFGNDAKGDLNGDGIPDVAFILTQDGGGSGTFYYLAAARYDGRSYHGMNAVLLGDRIAPQGTEIKDGKVMVYYADRKPEEPMTAVPSVGVSKVFKVSNGQLVEQTVPSQIVGRKWQWVRTLMSDNQTFTPEKAAAFSLTFKTDGSVVGTTDCNGFFGNYEATNDSLSFSGLGSTLMYCQGSQEAIFTKSLGEVSGYMLDKSGNLVLLLKLDSGTMMFK